ncbi:hypothetical protein M758_10G040700 [Ceratodon purpureus]|nr:hypothetical protein M758_10G040700 [Ceratodon purpureus]
MVLRCLQQRNCKVILSRNKITSAGIDSLNCSLLHKCATAARSAPLHHHAVINSLTTPAPASCSSSPPRLLAAHPSPTAAHHPPHWDPLQQNTQLTTHPETKTPSSPAPKLQTLDPDLTSRQSPAP